jgi:hypothetical protein
MLTSFLWKTRSEATNAVLKMSERDRRLLKIANLSIADVARLLGCSRQAIHVGISQPQDYFSRLHLAALVLHAKRTDSLKLVEGIEREYLVGRRGPEIELIMPGYAGLDQLYRASENAYRIIIWLNENQDHINGINRFSYLAIEGLLLTKAPIIGVILPKQIHIAQGFIDSFPQFRDPAALVITLPISINLPTLILIGRNFLRAFVFTRLSVEEIEPADAQLLFDMASRSDATFGSSRVG